MAVDIMRHFKRILLAWFQTIGPVVLKFECQNFLEGFLQRESLGPNPRVSDPVGLGVEPKNLHFSQVLDDAGPGFEIHCSR